MWSSLPQRNGRVTATLRMHCPWLATVDELNDVTIELYVPHGRIDEKLERPGISQSLRSHLQSTGTDGTFTAGAMSAKKPSQR